MTGADPGLNSIGQIAVPVTDVDRAVAFYRDVLNMRLLFQAGSSSVIYYRVADVQASFAALTARGVTFEAGPHLVAKMPDHELRMAFLRDPDRNLPASMEEKRT